MSNLISYFKKAGFGFILFFLILGSYLYFNFETDSYLKKDTELQNIETSVEVTTDIWGVPHIQAQNKKDALRALGYIVASQRLFQMEIIKRLIQGELSEIFGPAAIESDQFYRNLAFRKYVIENLNYRASANLESALVKGELEAYFDGVNQFIQNNPAPLEFKLLGIKPRPFDSVDAYVMTAYMGFSFAIAIQTEPLMTELLKKLDIEKFQKLRIDPLPYPNNTEKDLIAHSVISPLDLIRKNQSFVWQKTQDVLFDFQNKLSLPFFEGSNAWLISRNLTKNRKPILANDPHIGFSNPAVWFEAHLKTPDYELYGMHLPLVPFAVLGHNKNKAWGFTMSVVDDMDLYKLTIDEKNERYLYNNEWLKLTQWQEVIKIKGQSDIQINLSSSHYGPVLNLIKPNQNLSLRWSYYRPTNDTMRSLYLMGESKDMNEFEEALKFTTSPGINVLYADLENIAWWVVGDIPIKKVPHSDVILKGDSDKSDYERYLSWSERPQSKNPMEGFIVSANARPQGFTYLQRGDWQKDDRYQTIYQHLLSRSDWDIEQTQKLQTLNYNIRSTKIVDRLMNKIEPYLKDFKFEYLTESVIKDLKNWNGLSNEDSFEAALYHVWVQNVLNEMTDFLSEQEKVVLLKTPYDWFIFNRELDNMESTPEVAQKVAKALDHAVQFVDERTWGELHTLELVHPLGRGGFPLNKIFNVGPYSVGGGYNEINNLKSKSMAELDFKVAAGPSTRRIIDMAHPELSYSINPLGNSENIFSKIRAHQTKMFINGEYKPQWLNDEDIDKNKMWQMTFNPKN